MVVADIGDSLFGAADLIDAPATRVLQPGLLHVDGLRGARGGRRAIANRELRPLVLVGDGAFQMTGMELSTAVRLKLQPDRDRAEQQGLHDRAVPPGGPFNDLQDWRFHKMPRGLRRRLGLEVRTEGDLERALATALNQRDTISILNVHLDRDDVSPALERLTSTLRKRI